jgi:hypothetical protein
MRRTIPALLLLAACGSDSPDPGKCYQETRTGSVEVACPPEEAPAAAPLCVTPGGESVTPVSGCTWTTPTPVAPYTVQYGTIAAQSCDVYAPASPTAGLDADVMIVSSGFTGGSRAAAAWVTWAQHRASLGHVAAICDTRHSVAGGTFPFPAPMSDARCAYRVVAALAPSTHVKAFGASSGADLADLADATADRTSLTSGTTTITLDDGTCSVSWASTDAALVTRVNLWSEPGDFTHGKASVNPGSQPNMNAYANMADPISPDLLAIMSPVKWYRSTMAPRLVMASAGDGVVYPEHTVGTGDPTQSASRLTCTSVHPASIAGTLNAVRAAGPNCTAILNACPDITHLPKFLAPLTSGECTSDIF